ncbi:MAG: hypothetical protein JXR91_04800 [Deltaproteobacteria bacterium]|nr:hypothetical protein [Deltaproteobacteria bacterium]
MKRKLWILTLISLFTLAWGGCSDDLTSDTGSGTGDTDTNNGDGNGNGTGDSSSDSTGGNGSDFQVCATATTDMTRIATRVMLLEDKSKSMEKSDKWNLAMAAIEGMVTEFDNDIAFGLDLLPAAGNEMCGINSNVVEDVAVGNADTILGTLEQTGPENATPLYLNMSSYLNSDYAPIFLDGKGESYLVIISDGMDTCGAEGVFEQNGYASTSADLEAVTTQLLTDYGIKTIVIGFGDGADPDQLDAIAAAGGTAWDKYIPAGDGDALSTALKDIAQTVVVSCKFEIGTFDAEDVNLDLVNVLFDGTPVPRDDDCAQNTGWSWIDDSRTAIQFCDKACATLEKETVNSIDVQIACSSDDVSVVGID